MCSRKCDFPVWPSSSFREPTRYQIMLVTIGDVWTSFVKTTKPFVRTVLRTSSVAKAEGIISEDMSVFRLKLVRLLKNGRVAASWSSRVRKIPYCFEAIISARKLSHMISLGNITDYSVCLKCSVDG